MLFSPVVPVPTTTLASRSEGARTVFAKPGLHHGGPAQSSRSHPVELSHGLKAAGRFPFAGKPTTQVEVVGDERRCRLAEMPPAMDPLERKGRLEANLALVGAAHANALHGREHGWTSVRHEQQGTRPCWEVEPNPLSQRSFHLLTVPKIGDKGWAARAETPRKRRPPEWQSINAGTAESRQRHSRRIDFLIISYGDPHRSRKGLAPSEIVLVGM
jgi:hypothetical protein